MGIFYISHYEHNAHTLCVLPACNINHNLP